MTRFSVKILILVLALSVLFTVSSSASNLNGILGILSGRGSGNSHSTYRNSASANVGGSGSSVYNRISNHKLISRKVFMLAYKGFKKMNPRKKDVLTIVDFSKASLKKRLYVIDLRKNKIIYNTYVAHGKNSGVIFPRHFSNKEDSNKSSLGFYKTAETYSGKHGYSLKLDGMEPGINSNIRDRHIVMHSAEYVSQDWINKYGRLGRSEGCLAVPEKYIKKIIKRIKGGSCIFVYANDKNYLRRSKFLK